MMNVPHVRASITMRSGKTRYPNRARYMPHIVLGDPNQRVAIIGTNNTNVEEYLGVWISGGPDELRPGETAEVDFKLMYWPNLDYAGVVPGATFTVREGSEIVANGVILSPISEVDVALH